MKNLVFCLYNRLSCRYGDVFMSPTVGFAQKQVADVSRNSHGSVNLDELELCEIGKFDVENGILESLPVPVRYPWSIVRSLESKADSIDDPNDIPV